MANEPCCPACGGTRGTTHMLTETHLMNAAWGGDAEAGDSGINAHRSAVRCEDCKKIFYYGSLRRKGLIDPPGATP